MSKKNVKKKVIILLENQINHKFWAADYVIVLYLTESSYSAWPQLQSFYIWRQFAFVFQFLDKCTSVHFNSWITLGSQ